MKDWRSNVPGLVLSVAAIGQIVLSILFYDRRPSDLVTNIGWLVLWVSAVFGWLPIMTFKRWGGVAKGETYTETTTLVDRGIYAVVRHPQYLSGMLLALAFSLIAQHWAVILLGLVVAGISYAGTYQEERDLEAKFGQAYRGYRDRVPRVNFLLGLARLLRRGMR